MISIDSAGAARLRAGDDRGFALIFVLFVTTMVMIGTATMLAVTTGGTKPSKQNQDTAAAQAAAQAGAQVYLATLDANCRPTSIAQCTWLQNRAQLPLTGTVGTGSYSTRALDTVDYTNAANDGLVRLVSTGTSPAGSANAVTQTITVDVSGRPSPLSVAYFSNYETVGSSFLNGYYDPRTIALTNIADAGAVGLAVGTTVTWKGASAARADGMSDSICDRLWYDDASNATASNSSTSGRSGIKAALTSLPTGMDYAEDGTTTTLLNATAPVTRYAPCETTFTKDESFNGPVYSRDAFYLSNGTPGATSGPSFVVPSAESLPALWTGWTTSDTPAATPANPYRSFPILGGVPAPGSGTVASSPFAGLSLPTSIGITAGTCTFSGPTTISLSGSTATVTSPLTSGSVGSTCPATLSGGVYTVPVTTTTLYVKNSSSSLTSSALNTLAGLQGTGLTYFSPSAGDAYVSSSSTLTSGKLSVVSDDDVIVTGNVLASSTTVGNRSAADGKQPTTTDPASGEPSWAQGSAAIDLVAANDVRVYHPVSCATGNVVTAPNGGLSATATNGWCSNDLTGLYSTAQGNIVTNADGSLKNTHPSLQYANTSTGSAAHEIDAAIFALNGSFYADNFDRGTALGTLLVSGGVYENHHGPLGEQWITPGGSSSRAGSGYKLKINYLSYLHAGLGYVPELSGGNDLQPWQVVSTSSGGS